MNRLRSRVIKLEDKQTKGHWVFTLDYLYADDNEDKENKSNLKFWRWDDGRRLKTFDAWMDEQANDS